MHPDAVSILTLRGIYARLTGVCRRLTLTQSMSGRRHFAMVAIRRGRPHVVAACSNGGEYRAVATTENTKRQDTTGTKVNEAYKVAEGPEDFDAASTRSTRANEVVQRFRSAVTTSAGCWS